MRNVRKKKVQSMFGSSIIHDMIAMNEHFMEHALHLAEKGIGTTSPNPRVGAVVVSKGEIAGEGWHEKAGAPHAEVAALRSAGGKAKGSNLYVTMEPCSTTGKTPPCTDEIVKAGVRKVFIGSVDPNPRNSGSGIEILRANGIEVEVGILEEQCRKLNEGFEKYVTQGLPFVTVKAAMSLDGKIATRTGESKWITGEQSRKRVHMMRNETDAIIVGIGTVMKDNPHLTVRGISEAIHEPKKIVVDARAEINLESNLLSETTAPSTIIAVTEAADNGKLQNIRNRGAEILLCADSNGRVDMKDLMKKLAEKGIVYTLAEGGGVLIAALLENGLVDKVALFYAPILIGGRDAVSVVMGEGFAEIDKAIRVDDITIETIGEDFLVQGYIRN